MNKEEFLSACSQDYDKWAAQNEGQTDGYELERSLDELMTQLGRRMLQLRMGKLPGDHRKKNDPHPVRED